MPSEPLLAAYAEQTEAQPADLTRLRARLRAAHRSEATARTRFRPALTVGLGLVAATGLVFFLTASPTPTPVAATFDGSVSSAVEVAPGVTITAAGTGSLTGTQQAPRVAWSAGAIELSVEPGAGLDVTVQTDEALVQVVGTVFAVDRGPLGTAVGVRRGTVLVTCADGTTHTLQGNDSTTCWPATAVGLLGRAQAQRTAGTLPEEVLPTVERGLATQPDPTVHTELSALRVTLLAEGNAPEAAIDAAADHLARAENGRREEVARIGAALGYARSGCEGSQPFLSSLPPAEVAASALSLCQTDGGAPPSR